NRRIVFAIHGNEHFVAAFDLSIADKTDMAVAIFTPGRERAGEGHKFSGLQNRGGGFAAGVWKSDSDFVCDGAHEELLIRSKSAVNRSGRRGGYRCGHHRVNELYGCAS